MKKIILTLMVLFLIPVMGGCKKKMDLAKYEAVCAKVEKCDQRAAALGGKVKCQEALAKMATKKNMGAIVPMIVNCLEEAPCGELKLDACFTKIIQGGNFTPVVPKTPKK